MYVLSCNTFSTCHKFLCQRMIGTSSTSSGRYMSHYLLIKEKNCVLRIEYKVARETKMMFKYRRHKFCSELYRLLSKLSIFVLPITFFTFKTNRHKTKSKISTTVKILAPKNKPRIPPHVEKNCQTFVEGV